MKNRYYKYKFVDVRGKAIKIFEDKIIEFSEGEAGELIIRVLSLDSNNIYSKLPTVSVGEYAEELSVYTDDAGDKAIVPQGWTVSGFRNENTIWGRNIGLVIYRIPKSKVSRIRWYDSKKLDKIQRTYDQIVWNPVELLTANGTLDGIHFNEKFGRMNYHNDEFSEKGYNEPLVGELALQKESVDKYGGYWSSRYDISKDEKTGKPRSVKGAYPWTEIDLPTAKKVAATMVKSKTVTTHLMYGTEYDTIEKWIIGTGTKTLEDIVEDSTTLGNHWNAENSQRKLVKTGEDGCINNIYGFAGNVKELTQEKKESSYCVIRGASCGMKGDLYPVACRNYYNTDCSAGCNTGFRVAFCIK